MSRSIIATALLVCSGCAFYARGPEEYRSSVRTLLDQQKPKVQACYQASYDADNNAQGNVVAKFEVEKKTGKIVKPEIVPEGTTANDALKQCVLGALDGLTLTPPDQRTGQATFAWSFAR